MGEGEWCGLGACLGSGGLAACVWVPCNKHHHLNKHHIRLHLNHH